MKFVLRVPRWPKAFSQRNHWKDLPRKASRRLPGQIPKPPQLASFGASQKRRYIEFLWDVWATHPIFKNLTTQQGKNIFQPLELTVPFSWSLPTGQRPMASDSEGPTLSPASFGWTVPAEASSGHGLMMLVGPWHLQRKERDSQGHQSWQLLHTDLVMGKTKLQPTTDANHISILVSYSNIVTLLRLESKSLHTRLLPMDRVMLLIIRSAMAPRLGTWPVMQVLNPPLLKCPWARHLTLSCPLAAVTPEFPIPLLFHSLHAVIQLLPSEKGLYENAEVHGASNATESSSNVSL